MNFSIIICTYNPNLQLFSNLLRAIKAFDRSGIYYEVIIVDNCSFPSINSHQFVQDYISSEKNVHILSESRQGLTYSRLTGLQKAKYDWIVLFDDDNEPASDYLIKAAEAIIKYPQTAAWGASEVEVKFIGNHESWIYAEKSRFQERNLCKTIMSNQRQWQECYPYGTGLIIQKNIGLLYAKRVIEKRYTLSDRKEKKLSSGGDIQLVLTAIEQGLFAGVIGGMKIKHIIDASKTSITYLQKLQYGTASAYIKAFNQVFTDSPISVDLITNKRILLLIYSLFRIHRSATTKERFLLLLAEKMGQINARAEALSNGKPILLKVYEKIIHA